MHKKKFFLLMTLILSSIFLVISFSAFAITGEFFNTDGIVFRSNYNRGVSYILVLNETNRDPSLNSSPNTSPKYYSVTTNNGNPIQIARYRCATGGDHIQINSSGNGYIYNVDPITGFNTITISLSGSQSGTSFTVYGAKDKDCWVFKQNLTINTSVETKNVTLPSGEKYNYFAITADSGNAKINSIQFSYDCIYYNENEKESDPSLSFSTPSEMWMGDTLALNGNATGYYNDDITSQIVYTETSGPSGNNIVGTNFIPQSTGNYTLQADIPNIGNPITRSSLATSSSIAVNRILDGHYDAEQYPENTCGTLIQNPGQGRQINITDDGMSYFHLNIPESYYYYVEFKITDLTWGGTIGVAHGSGNDVYSHNNDMLKLMLLPSEKAIYKGYNNRSKWSDGYVEKHENLNGYNYYPFNDSYMKLGIARVGTLFYTFINDKYESATEDTIYSYTTTKPAFWCNAYGANGADLTISDINALKSEQEVRAKVTDLLGGYYISPYVPNTQWWGYSSNDIQVGYNDYYGEHVNISSNSIDQNQSIVSPWISFAKGFTFEFDYYKGSCENTGNDEDNRMWVELRPMCYGPSLLKFGLKTKTNWTMMDANDEIFSSDTSEIIDWYGGYAYHAGGKYSQEELSEEIVSGELRLHFKLERTYEDLTIENVSYENTQKYTMTISSIINPNFSISRDLWALGTNYKSEIDGTVYTYYTDLVKPSITNRKSSGIIANLKYTTTDGTNAVPINY